jgi:hypothetical protein
LAGAVKYAPHPLVWPSAAAVISPVVGTTELLADHTNTAPVTVVGAGVAIIFAPRFGVTFVA